MMTRAMTQHGKRSDGLHNDDDGYIDFPDDLCGFVFDEDETDERRLLPQVRMPRIMMAMERLTLGPRP